VLGSARNRSGLGSKIQSIWVCVTVFRQQPGFAGKGAPAGDQRFGPDNGSKLADQVFLKANTAFETGSWNDRRLLITLAPGGFFKRIA